MLHEFVTLYTDEIIIRCRAKVAARSAPPPTKAEIDHGVPMFLEQLVEALHPGGLVNTEIGLTASQHGRDLLNQGLTASQVVHDYGDICQAITELAIELRAPISTDDFRTLNRCLDDAIASAVTEYGRTRDYSARGEAAGETERLKGLAYELRSSIHKASAALEAIKSGRVGIAGSTGTLLDTSLFGAYVLIDRLLAELDVTPCRTPDSVT